MSNKNSKEESTAYFVLATDNPAVKVEKQNRVIESLKVHRESEVTNNDAIQLLNDYLPDGANISSINRDDCRAKVKMADGELLDWKYSFAYVGTPNGPAIGYYPKGFTGM